MSIKTPTRYITTAMSSRAAAASLGTLGACHAAGCACPACQGLTSLVRPRFFAGQVLNEVDLMELERYAMSAHRMHNRYLHGPGVVCGLELVCEDCGDGVVVRPGYALDPCGRDLIVSDPQQVDVGRLISDCLAAERSMPACDPPTVGPPKGCDSDQHWCVTLRYREVPMRPQTPLAGTARTSSSCTCGCGGNGNGNGKSGCGCGGAATPTAGWSCTCGQGGSRSTQACGCVQYVAAADLPPGCEPTRIAECFDIGVCRCDGTCCSLGSVLQGTIIEQLACCFQTVWPMVGKRLSKSQQRATLTAVLGTVGDSEQTRSGICELYDAVLELYQRDPWRTMCQLPSELRQIDCSPQGDKEGDREYELRLVGASQVLLLLVVAYLRDCFCHALNPPCADACDDRVVLGCVTVRDGKALEICNLECRRYAGSFVSRRYWLPVGPVLLWVLGVLCCFPLLGRGRLGGFTTFGRVLRAADPSGNVRRVLMQDDFAIARSWPVRAREALAKVKPAVLRDRFTPSAQAVNLAALEGRLAGDSEVALKSAGVSFQNVEVDSPDQVPVNRLGALGIVEPGTSIRQFIYRGRVVGFAAAQPRSQTTVTRSRGK